MNLGDLFNKENKNLCRWIGFVLGIVPLLYILSGGSYHPTGIRGYFHEWFLVVITIMMLLGMIFLLAGFSKNSDSDDENKY